MNKEIPEFLLRMSKQMQEEDNRLTAHPLWQVCYDAKLSTEKDINNEGFWLISDRDSEICFRSEIDDVDDVVEHMLEYCGKECENLPLLDYASTLEEVADIIGFNDCCEGYSIEYYQKVRTVVKSCLTEQDAEAFIARKQHDYAPLYTYVVSMIFCPQMIELREWIRGLTQT